MGTLYFAEINSFTVKRGTPKFKAGIDPRMSGKEDLYTFPPKIERDDLEMSSSNVVYETPKCFADNESFSFLIIWSIFNYIVILLFGILLITWYDVN